MSDSNEEEDNEWTQRSATVFVYLCAVLLAGVGAGTIVGSLINATVGFGAAALATGLCGIYALRAILDLPSDEPDDLEERLDDLEERIRQLQGEGEK